MSTDNFIWTDELVEEYRKFCIENNSVALMLGAVGIIELFKLNIKNGGNITPNDIISAAYKSYEQSEQPHKDYEILSCKYKKNGKSLFTSKDRITVEEYLYITTPDWEEGYKRLKEILKQKTL